MKRKILQLMVILFMSATGVHAQTSCSDLNGYVSFKNTLDTGFYTLNAGYEEKAAQTYHYSGSGRITSVRLHGDYQNIFGGGVPLRVGIYNVDNTGRPTTLIQAANTTWWWFNNFTGFIDVNFSGGGVLVSADFAVEVELRSVAPWGNSFKLQYTGNGEGNGENLASLAGTSTGNNWTSAMNDFQRDGDFYLVPRITNYITSNFDASSYCVASGGTVNFTNSSTVSMDSMFNLIAMPGYAGSEHFYAWNFGDGSPESNAVNPSHVYSTPGVYTVTLTTTLVGWHNTCSNEKTMQISVGLSGTVSSIVNATCNGALDGSATAIASGGASPYTYSINDQTFSATPHFTGLGAGSYQVGITDNLGCSVSNSFTITQPTAITVTSVQTTNASCGNADGGILVAATGGTGTLRYKLNSGAYQISGQFSNKASGSYTVTVKDANDCTTSFLVTISNSGAPVLSLLSTTNVSCNGANDASIVLNATGGSGVLQYSIDGGTTFQSNGSFLNIYAGTYAAMVKDANGCSKSMVINITQPQALSVYASSFPVKCNGESNGQIAINAAGGGTGSFTYSVNGNVYQSSTNFPGLSAGEYVVFVKDVAGCIGRDTVIVTQPTLITATAVTAPTTCYDGNDGTITITAAGGSGTYVYGLTEDNFQQSPIFDELSAGTYVIRVKDKNNCLLNVTATVGQPTAITATINVTTSTCGSSNGGFLAIASGGSGSGYQYSINSTNFNSTGLFNGLAAGTYYVICEDAVGCTVILPANITDANGPVIGSTSHTNIACNGGNDGSITVNNVTGGTGTLQYSINGTNWQTSTVFTGLNAGTFSVFVKDANGCTGTITETLTEPNGFVITTSLQDIECYGAHTGAATIFASGGSGVFAYSLDGTSFQSSSTFTGLVASNHAVIVRDAAGCTSSVLFTLTQPTQITIQHGELNVTCNGANDGGTVLFGSGGTGFYNYSIDGNTYQSSNVFLGLDGGNYTGYVKDANGCVKTVQISVSEPAPLVVASTVSNVSCAGGSNGIVTLNVSGGTQPYDYAWSNETGTQNLFNLTAGAYAVTVNDNNHCSFAASYTVTEPSSPLIVNGVVVDATTETSADGEVTITITGGVAPYTYLWSNGATTRDLSGVTAASYSVNITDANGCITTGIFMVGSVTGISELLQNGIAVSLYPNPSTDMAIIEVSKFIISNMKIVNLNGEVVLESEPNQAKEQINTNTLSSGVYFVKLRVNGNVITKKLVVTK